MAVQYDTTRAYGCASRHQRAPTVSVILVYSAAILKCSQNSGETNVSTFALRSINVPSAGFMHLIH
jgi:hypothetical protein